MRLIVGRGCCAESYRVAKLKDGARIIESEKGDGEEEKTRRLYKSKKSEL